MLIRPIRFSTQNFLISVSVFFFFFLQLLDLWRPHPKKYIHAESKFKLEI